MKVAVVFAVLLLSTPFSSLVDAAALPANFSGSYRILQSRLLALTNGRGYVLQDGALVALNSVNRQRPYCRADQSKFDELDGTFDAEFKSSPVDGFDHSFVRTVLKNPTHQPLTIECIAETGFSGALDLKIALGRIVDIVN